MKRVKLVLLATLLVAFSVVGINGKVYSYTADYMNTTADTITSFYSIPCVAFLPFSSSYHYLSYTENLYSTTAGDCDFFAPVYLPDGAKVIEFKAWVYDINASVDVRVDLGRRPLANFEPAQSLVTLFSSGIDGLQELSTTMIEHDDIIDNSTYKYWTGLTLRSGDDTHRLLSMRIKYKLTSPWGIKESQDEVNPSSALNINAYPVPAFGRTTITYEVLRESNVSLDIYNLLGMKVKTMVAGSQASGEYQVFWDGTDIKGNKVPAGDYFYRLEIDGKIITKKGILLK